MNKVEHVVYSFGAFSLDTRRRLLLAGDDAVALTPKAYDLLLYLVEHRGQVIEKGDLLDAVWPNVVVEENNLTQAISGLRRALGERPQEHRFITTVPGRGYQFVADVRVLGDAQNLTRHESPARSEAETVDAIASGPGPARQASTPRQVRSRKSIVAGLLFVAIAGLLLFRQFAAEDQSIVEHRSLRITASELVGGAPGGQSQPAFSPDGSRAAFVSNVAGVPQVFVINLERGAARQLTHDAAGATDPDWSPLDDRIVYQSGRGGIWSIDPMGTLKPRLVVEDGLNPRFARDGLGIVYEVGSEIRLANVDGSAQRVVAGVPFGDRLFVRAYPSLSPDGSEIVFFQQSIGPLGDYWIVPANGGQARQLTFDLHWGGRATWMPDGAQVIFPSKRGGTLTLWSVPSAGGDPEPLTTGLGEDAWPAVSADGRRILYATTRIESFFVITEPQTLDERILYRSRRLIAFPRVSPGGDMIAFFSEIEPREQVMVMSLDDSAVEQVTEFHRHEANVFPRWSADGQSIYYYQNLPPASLRRTPVGGGPYEEVFAEFSWDLNPDLEISPSGEHVAFVRVDPNTRQRRVVIMNLSGGEETLLPPGIRFAPSWSADEQYLLGTAPDRVFVCPVSGADCAVIFDGDDGRTVLVDDVALGHFAQWSADESRIYFARRTANPGMLALWVVDRDGGNARHLFDYGPVHPLAGRFQVLADDTILWDRYDHGESELVLATLSRSGN